MPKRWTLTAHPIYFQTLRNNVPNPEERYLLVSSIFDRFQETDDPTAGATSIPGVFGQYEVEIRGRIIFFALPEERPNDIDLLEVI